jgi:hypothetical protein
MMPTAPPDASKNRPGGVEMRKDERRHAAEGTAPGRIVTYSWGGGARAGAGGAMNDSGGPLGLILFTTLVSCLVWLLALIHHLPTP